ncbi:NDR1/HIN1-like protein 1 [Elaeis guineensis]|uniref:NDR1/HIN1-like protein 1 n=1 Tax=Elaeis guineensis var. tenera TaxID=51953 RepID=A0A6I9QIV4_ELAGV|nr:NDR1/HIN1-like protein 1 [Elaeis guineensis]
MSFKDWVDDGYWQWKQHKLFRRLFTCFLCLIILVLFVILVVWLVLRPSKPKFYLQEATVGQFNLSDPNLLSSVIQVSISSRNPNDHISIYYDRLDVYADYRGQQISAPPTALPTIYQDRNDVIVWSPYLNGTAIPLAPYLASAVVQDESAEVILIHIKIDGSLRWKVGTWISGHYHFNVNCPAFFTVDSSKRFLFENNTSCSVDV